MFEKVGLFTKSEVPIYSTCMDRMNSLYRLNSPGGVCEKTAKMRLDCSRNEPKVFAIEL